MKLFELFRRASYMLLESKGETMYKKIVACVLTLTMMLSVSPVLAKQKSETVKSGTVNSITNEYKKISRTSN